MSMRIICTGILFFLSFGLTAQSNWLVSFGNLVHEEILDAEKDASGNIISVGYLSGPTTIGTTNLNSNGNSDILIIKTDNAGNVIWATKAGGIGPDRAYAVDVDDNGNIYITGYFYNAATFDTISLTGQDRDVFVAKINPSGNFLWVKNCGGEFGDTGYGVAVDNSGNVLVTGQFRGNGVFGADNFLSTTDPNTSQPAYDFFLSKLDGGGNFLWTREANAKYDDRGMSVTVDELNNIYVAGQFSDTITFQNTHNNQAMNAGFVIKYDASGNEIWFDKYRAAQVLLYDIKWQNDQLYLTGDFKGNMQVSHQAGNTNFSAGGEFNILVSKLDENGNLSWFKSNFSDNEITAKQLALDVNNDIYITGLFKCDFTEMNQLHGNSTFLSLGYRDVHYLKYSTAGNFQWARQFGSNEDDYCSAIVLNDIDHPVMAGSFENAVVIPSNDISGTGTINCSWTNYDEYEYDYSQGGKDIFLTDPFDISRAPLDYYLHNTSCDYDTLVPCILNCEDTVEFCESPQYPVYVNHFMLSEPVMPKYSYLWSNGDDEINTEYNAGGNIWIKTWRQDGCAAYTDTMFLWIHPNPETPFIADNWGYKFYEQTSGFIDTCYQDSLKIWTIAADTITTSLVWSGGIYLNDSMNYINQSGIYGALAQTDYGCTSYNLYSIILDDFAIHDTLDPQIVFLNDHAQLTDTLYSCNPAEMWIFLTDSNLVATNGSFPYKSSAWYLNGNLIDSLIYFPDSNYSVLYSFPDSGWYSIDVHLVNECGDSVDYFIHRDLYVSIVPNPFLSITGPATLVGNYCPGDSLGLVVTTYADTLFWTGGVTTVNFTDTVYVTVGLGATTYSFGIDTVTPYVTCYAQASYTLPGYPGQNIELVDINLNGGIVCPGDSLEIVALSGQAWIWIGPQGDTLGTNQNVWVDLPGYYHCIVTDNFGCIVTSNFVEAKEYSSPFLQVEPQLICEGESAEIIAVANPFTSINWLAPLSGSAPNVIVDSAGIYYCETNFCNITLIDSVIVMESIPLAQIIAVPDTTFCPGDTISLFANGGMMNYIWNGNNTGESIFQTTQAGTYILETENEIGCTASDTIEVTLLSNPASPVSANITICSGDDAVLFASADDSVFWFDQSGLLLGTGDSISIFNITSPTQIQVMNFDSICFSLPQPVNINFGPSATSNGDIDTTICYGDSLLLQSFSADVIWLTQTNDTLSSNSDFQTSSLFSDTLFYFEISQAGFCSVTNSATVSVIQNNFTPLFLSPSLICENDSALIALGNSGVTSYSWFDQNGVLSDSSQFVLPTDSAGTFDYGVVLDYFDCATDTAYFSIVVNPLPLVEISSLTPTVICPDDSVQLLATTNADSIYWPVYGTSDSLITVWSEMSYYYMASLNGCTTISDSILVTFLPVTNYNTPLYDTVCSGSTSEFILNVSGDVVWTNMDFDTLATGNSFTTPPLYQDYEYFYCIVTDSGFCPSTNLVDILVLPVDFTPDYSTVSDLCLGDSVLIAADDQTQEFYFWIQNGDTISTNSFISILPDSAGLVSVELVTGTAMCYSDTAYVSVNINDLPSFNLPEDTLLCINENLIINTTYNYTIDWIYETDSTGFGFDTLAAITFINNNGCSFTDTIQIIWSDCSLFMPNIFTPDNNGINDILFFETDKGEVLSLTIQNRWGNIIYNSTAGEWDGLDNNGSPSVAGTYFYVIEYKTFDETILIEQGWFYLQR